MEQALETREYGSAALDTESEPGGLRGAGPGDSATDFQLRSRIQFA
jgi:hypothetical protein